MRRNTRIRSSVYSQLEECVLLVRQRSVRGEQALAGQYAAVAGNDVLTNALKGTTYAKEDVV
jgi:hypothetical protein